MGLSVSLGLIVLGAILYWAVTTTFVGIGANTLGVIFMLVGVAGLLLSLVYWSSWGGFGRRRTPAH